MKDHVFLPEKHHFTGFFEKKTHCYLQQCEKTCNWLPFYRPYSFASLPFDSFAKDNYRIPLQPANVNQNVRFIKMYSAHRHLPAHETASLALAAEGFPQQKSPTSTGDAGLQTVKKIFANVQSAVAQGSL